jgi:hypothetical protein
MLFLQTQTIYYLQEILKQKLFTKVVKMPSGKAWLRDLES